MRALLTAVIAATFASFLPFHDASALVTSTEKWPLDPPFVYCRNSFEWVATLGVVDSWACYMQVLPADFGKAAYAFIAFRRPSIPDQFWFTDGLGTWRLPDATHPPFLACS